MITRRDFLKGMAASVALMTAGCTSRERGKVKTDSGEQQTAEKWVKGVCRSFYTKQALDLQVFITYLQKQRIVMTFLLLKSSPGKDIEEFE